MFNRRALPFAVFFSIIFTYLLFRLFCWKKRIQAQVSSVSVDQAQAQAQDQAQSSHEQQQAKPNKGLNQETIDSYPTMVVGDMLKLDDNTCPICLCEYDQSDVLKILPECVHRFHCECLVEWLKLNDTCPVCRTHPPRLD